MGPTDSFRSLRKGRKRGGRGKKGGVGRVVFAMRQRDVKRGFGREVFTGIPE